MAKQRNLKFEKAARIYLDLRSFKVLEQNWSQGKNKIDVIASKNNTLYFITLKSLENTAQQLDIAETRAEDRAMEAYLLENKITSKSEKATILIDPKSTSIVSFIS